MQELKRRSNQKGYNVATGKYEDLVKAGNGRFDKVYPLCNAECVVNFRPVASRTGLGDRDSGPIDARSISVHETGNRPLRETPQPNSLILEEVSRFYLPLRGKLRPPSGRLVAKKRNIRVEAI